jgi:hypothetical protein
VLRALRAFGEEEEVGRKRESEPLEENKENQSSLGHLGEQSCFLFVVIVVCVVSNCRVVRTLKQKDFLKILSSLKKMSSTMSSATTT